MTVPFRILVLLLSLVASAIAQPAPAALADLVSPELAPDGRATFRLFAPAAQTVAVVGQWDDQPHALAKDEHGVWSVTVGPIAPGFWIYNFTVDGMAIADPVNPQVKLRMRTSASLLDVPAKDASAPWDIRTNVPHGAVEIVWHNSKVIGDTRAFYVYTPPGYDPTAATRYPVLYLVHGSNGTAADWTAAGRANFMADNLLAAGRMAPMIIVMPAGHALPFIPSAQAGNGPLFDRYLVEELIPAVEAKYRVLADRDHRALMGLSMGGAHALRAGFSHPELFSALGAFSAGPVPDFETRFQPLLADAAGTNAKFKLIWIGCGRQDPAFARSEKFDAVLTAAGIHHTFRSMEGVHNYVVWRQCFLETVPLLFRP